ncbi:MAG: HNH endonuclease [Kaiparowitsia implicata GSE-PSE-MK54-09C]|nr:HNH endonuclease [Kaiparowitsia implicata GSE-PSE-MK54-09C]
MNSVKETEFSPLVEAFQIGLAEQSLFAIKDTRKRADQLQELLVPKLKILLNYTCDLIREAYGSDSLLACRITTTPAHRTEAKNTKAFEAATAGLAIKGQAWFFQLRFECTFDKLYATFFGLRGLEGNPIVQVLKTYPESVIKLLTQGDCKVYSETIKRLHNTKQLNLSKFIDKLQLVPERDWYRTSLEGRYHMIPIEDLDAALPVINEFVTLSPVFRAAADVLCGENDCFENYVKRFWNWQNGLQIQESVATTHFSPDEVDSAEKFVEGAAKRVLVNAYERDPKARQKRLDYYGLDCSACGFNFGKVFRELGEGFIHVHHVRPISQIAEEYEVDPVKDLRPVCPNCHAMIHRRSPPLSIEEIKKLLNASENEEWTT